MNIDVLQSRPWSSKASMLGLLIILAVGLFLRFHDLGRKVYAEDEMVTSLHVSGFTEAELRRDLFDGRVHAVQKVQDYQRATRARSVADTVHALAVDDPVHPPLYYVAEWLWTKTIGSGISARRSLSALFGALAILCMVWLGVELFGSRLAGVVGGGLLLLSPFHILYSQQAREYSLWALLVLLSGTLLLRAIAPKSPLDRPLYALALVCGLYTSVYFLSLVVAYCLYVLFLTGFRLTRASIAVMVASLASVVAYSPWLWILWKQREAMIENNVWSATIWPFKFFLEKWAFNISALFFDREYVNLRLVGIASLFILVAAYALWRLFRSAPKREWSFVAALIVSSLPLVVPDLLHGEHRSTVARYLIPTWLGIQLATAYLFSSMVSASNSSSRRRLAWGIGLAGVLFLEGLSSALDTRAQVWYVNSRDGPLLPISQLINEATNPLVISQGNVDLVMDLSNLVRPGVDFELTLGGVVPKIPGGYKNTFLLAPTPSLLKDISRRGFRVTQAYVPTVTRTPLSEFRMKLRADQRAVGLPEAQLGDTASLWRVSR